MRYAAKSNPSNRTPVRASGRRLAGGVHGVLSARIGAAGSEDAADAPLEVTPELWTLIPKL
eukprot:3174774-Rhodomonas_salina.1